MPLKTPRTTVKRLPKRGRHDFETIAAILDATFLCHLGFVAEGQPYVIPTAFGRDGRTLYVHGSAVSRTLKRLTEGVPMCLTATILDGLVLARSGFHSSMNYRSAVVLGTATVVEPDQKIHALEVISEQILPGRWAEIRGPSRKELNGTTVLQIPIEEASAKIRNAPPVVVPVVVTPKRIAGSVVEQVGLRPTSRPGRLDHPGKTTIGAARRGDADCVD